MEANDLRIETIRLRREKLDCLELDLDALGDDGDVKEAEEYYDLREQVAAEQADLYGAVLNAIAEGRYPDPVAAAKTATSNTTRI